MACALRARAASERGEEEVPDLRVQVLFYPWVDVRPNSDSMQSCQEDNDLHILMQEDLAFASEIYGPPRVKSSEEEEEEEEDDEPKVEEWMKVEEASPLLAGTLQNLPRTFLAYAADDLLAPDCRALVSRLRKEQGAEAVHELELPGPLGPGFAKDPTKAASYAALAAAGAFASGAFMGRHAAEENSTTGYLPSPEDHEGNTTLLSWLFRDAATVALRTTSPAATWSFEVRLPEEHPALVEVEGRWWCRASPFQLELPLGHSYPLQIRAVLRDGSDVLCSSAWSPSTTVDLRPLATKNGPSRLEAPSKPNFQEFLRGISPDRRSPYRRETSDEQRTGGSGGFPATSPSTSAGDATATDLLTEPQTPSASPRKPRDVAELWSSERARKAFFDFLPMSMVVRWRATNGVLKGQVALYLRARAGSSAEPDEPEADEVPEPDVCEPAQDEPPLARETKEELPEPAADQLAHISGLLRPSLPLPVRAASGSFRSAMPAWGEVQRDLGRLLADPSFRIFLLSSTASLRPLRLPVAPTILERLQLLLAEQLNEAPELGFAQRVATAMSATVGVDFAVQVGLMPQFHQPMFILFLGGGGPEVRLLVNGFVASKPKHVRGDRPERKCTPWLASLCSPELRAGTPDGSETIWEYSVREAYAEDTGSAVECFRPLLDAMAQRGWSGWPMQ
ncbi:Hypothetical protein SCF082_LOCUS43050 [Durusdinium trenchii]|uniref:Alpha/beta hydrolase fold-3 domain-containing protein n=1 Tax=Durusdinium trenchii TaxID=1381693 RepID=A0ABP0QU45_9DINO